MKLPFFTLPYLGTYDRMTSSHHYFPFIEQEKENDDR